jgi:hypothetical protein
MTTATKSKKAREAEDQAKAQANWPETLKPDADHDAPAASAPEDNPADEAEPTKEEYEAWEQQEAEPGAVPEPSTTPETASEPPNSEPIAPETGQTGTTAIASSLEAQLEAEAAEDASDEADDEEHRLAEVMREVIERNIQIAAAREAYEIAADEAKDLKKRLEVLQDDLNEFITESAGGNVTPRALFKDPANSDASQATPSQTTDADDDAWRAMTLAEALPELKATVIKKLNDASLYTMGELANWTAEDGGRHRLTDIAGIGKETSGKIEEATMAFWARRAAPAPAHIEPPAATMNPKAQEVAAAFRALVIPWAELVGIVPSASELAKVVTVGDLQDYARSNGILIAVALAEFNVAPANVKGIEAWLDDQFDRLEAAERLIPDQPDPEQADPAEPLRQFLATPIPWGDWDEAPADTTRLATIADLENQAASVGLGMIETLTNLSLSTEAAQVVVDWLEGQRKAVS